MLMHGALYPLIFVLDVPFFVAVLYVLCIESDKCFTRVLSKLFADVVLVVSTVVPFIQPLGTLYFAIQHGGDKFLLLDVKRRIKRRNSIAARDNS